MDGRWRTAIINALIIVLKTVFTNLAWMAYTYTVIKIQRHQEPAAGRWPPRAGLPEENMPAERYRRLKLPALCPQNKIPEIKADRLGDRHNQMDGRGLYQIVPECFQKLLYMRLLSSAILKSYIIQCRHRRPGCYDRRQSKTARKFRIIKSHILDMNIKKGLS